MNRPLFSIIIPVYNVAAYLRECLDSILFQTYADWEAICVDDGSTDGCAEILDGYAIRDNRFRILHQCNGGVCAARNRALDESQGDYVCFVDGDDVLDENWLANAAAIITETQCDLLRCGLTRWVEPYSRIKCSGQGSYRVIEGARNVFSWGPRTWLDSGYVVLGFLRRSCIRDVRFPEGVVLQEDSVFYIEALFHITRVAVSDYNGYYYRCRATSVTGVAANSKSWNEEPALRRCCEIFSKNKEWLDQNGLLASARQSFTKGMFPQLVNYFNRNAFRICAGGAVEIKSLCASLRESDVLDLGLVRMDWRVAFGLMLRFNITLPLLFRLMFGIVRGKLIRASHVLGW